MPIKGLTESRRLPRLGKIHMGIKKKAKSGALYPSATDYFVVPPEVAEVIGEKPTELPILFPIEDDEKFASQFYRSYSMTRGLVCRGDGETCRRMVDVKTGELANRNSTDITWKDNLPCQGKECPYYGKQCKEVMNLQFLLPTVEGLGIWQIDTSSINSIRNINSAIELIRGVYGRIAMIPLLLTLEPVEVTNPDDGKKKTVRVLNLRTKGTMIDLMERAVKPAREMLLPAPLDAEAPEDMLPVPDDGPPPELIMPQEQAPIDTASAVKSTTSAVKSTAQKTATPAPNIEQDLWPDESQSSASEPPMDEVRQTTGGIDMDWLRESLKQIKWTENTFKSWLKAQSWYKEGIKEPMQGTLAVVVGQLPLELQKRTVKEIQDRLDLA